MRDGESIYVRTIGRGAPCLVLHGFGMHSGHWLPFLAPFIANNRFIIPDMRGFGHSHTTPYNSRCILTNNVEDIDDTLKQLSIPKVNLIGLSLGAFTALQWHKLEGFNKVERYLNIDQSPLIINKKSWKWGIFGSESETRMHRLSEVLSVVQEFPTTTPYERLPNWVRKAMWQELGKFMGSAVVHQHHKKIVQKICKNEKLIKTFMPTDNWPAYANCLEAYLQQDYDMRPYLEHIDIPVTLMAGRKSEMYPWQGQAYMHRKIPNSKMIIFEKSGHLPLLNEPVRFIYELGRFLGQRRQSLSS